MINISPSSVSLVAACWALPYIASKIAYAVEGKLGVHGGPLVTAADLTVYDGQDAISQAQWGNVAVGVLILVISLLPLAPFSRRWNRWTRSVPVMIIAALVTVMGLLFGMRLISGDGGALFVSYLTIWAVLLWLLVIIWLRKPDREL